MHAKMRKFGGFEGNAQTLKILTKLEKYYRGEGIKPTRRLLLGVLKYPIAYSEYENRDSEAKPPKCFYDDDKELIERLLDIFTKQDIERFRSLDETGKPKYKSFDCSIMELADDIAYGVHDLEDGIGRGILKRDQVAEKLRQGFETAGVESVRDVSISDLIDKLFSEDSCERKHAISLLVGYFILSIKVKRRNCFESPHLDFEATVCKGTRQLLDCLSKEITYESIISRREIQTLEWKGQKVITDLFTALSEQPMDLIGKHVLNSFNSELTPIFERAEKEPRGWRGLDHDDQREVMRTICDFIAGMTNPYAEKYHRRLFEPGYGSSTDELYRVVASVPVRPH